MYYGPVSTRGTEIFSKQRFYASACTPPRNVTGDEGVGKSLSLRIHCVGWVGQWGVGVGQWVEGVSNYLPVLAYSSSLFNDSGGYISF